MGRRRRRKAKPVRTSGRLLAARWLLAAALGISIYLARVSLSGGAAAGCGAASPCNKVLQSHWAYWLGIPVSLPAVLIDTVLLVVAFSAPRPFRMRNRILLGSLCFLLIGAALWFTALQALVLRAFCPYCLTAHFGGLCGAALLLTQLRPPQPDLTRPKQPAAIDPSRARFWAGALGSGIGVLAALIVLQVLLPAKMFRLTTTAPARHEARWMVLHDGKFKLDLTTLPVIGSVDAPKIVVSLFDYTCIHCRDLHPFLILAQRQFSNQLAIVNLPMPLDSDCNRWVRQTPPAHVHACQFAKVGLALWRIDRAAFQEFDDWIFDRSRTLSLPEARSYAAQLVGQEKLVKALADPWVEEQIRTDIDLYAANSQQMHSGQIPQLIIGSTILTGPVDSLDALDRVLEENLGLAAPAR